MDSWWSALNLELQVFYGLGLLALFALVIQIGLSLFGGASDHSDLQTNSPIEHGSGLSPFSVQGITAFFVGFGWTGALCLRQGLSLGFAIPIAVIAGAVFMFAIYFLLRSMLQLQSSGNLNYQNTIGSVATVYSTISGDKQASGQVEIMLQGRLMMAEAMTAHSANLKPGAKVKVIRLIAPHTLLVEPLAV
jgi:membrane protein implicated in regulation of membrane protease activity